MPSSIPQRIKDTTWEKTIPKAAQVANLWTGAPEPDGVLDAALPLAEAAGLDVSAAVDVSLGRFAVVEAADCVAMAVVDPVSAAEVDCVSAADVVWDSVAEVDGATVAAEVADPDAEADVLLPLEKLIVKPAC